MRRRATRFDGAEALSRFVSELHGELERAGWSDAAERLRAVHETAFTTGSEWLGALGGAVSEIRARHALPGDLDAKLAAVAREARRAWPWLRGG